MNEHTNGQSSFELSAQNYRAEGFGLFFNLHVTCYQYVNIKTGICEQLAAPESGYDLPKEGEGGSYHRK